MKKVSFIILLTLILIIIIKYFSSDYYINYKMNEYDISINYNDSRFYIEINNGKTYNFDIYKSRGLKKLKIENIKEIKTDDYECIYPIIKGTSTYPLCYKEDEYINYNLIDDTEINKYKTTYEDNLSNELSYNKNLSKNEYIYIWNYKGFYKYNAEKEETIEMFKRDNYDASLITLMDDYLFIPDYNNEHYFKNIYIMDASTSKITLIENKKYEIYYDAYTVGNIGNKVYLYDIKNSNLYMINVRKKTIELVADESSGYIKYVDGKKISAKKSEYKNKEVSYIEKEYSYYKYEIISNSIYKIYNENELLKEKIFEGNNLKIIKEYKNNLYFLSEDILYKYDGVNIIKILNYFEFNFNTNNNVFIYNE